MHLNQGKFKKNGGCGYILKPDSLRDRGEDSVTTNFRVDQTSSNTPSRSMLLFAAIPRIISRIRMEFTLIVCIFLR